MLEGARFLREAATAGAAIELLVTTVHDRDELADLEAVAQRAVVVSEREFKRLSVSGLERGALGVLQRRVRATAELAGSVAVVALDGVQDPGNVGTLVRSAAALSDSVGVVLGPGCADPFGPKAARAAAGALERVVLSEVDELGVALSELRSRGFRLVGLDPSAPRRLVRATSPEVLVVGSEGRGVSAALSEVLDDRRALVVPPRLESLNAAVAGALALWVSLGLGEPAADEELA